MAIDLRTLTIEQAQALIGESFEVALADGRLQTMRLDDALLFDSRPRRVPRGAPAAKRQAFALYFLGPADGSLPQGMYEFRHPTSALGQVFIVPIGRDDAATEYEAVFT